MEEHILDKLTVVYLAFGERKDIVRQILFSALSIKQFNEKDVAIVVMTDSPQRFLFAKNYCRLVRLTSDVLKDWSGTHNFMWRIKIKAIEHCVSLYSDSNILYFDSDTVAINPLQNLNRTLSSGYSLMHTNEGVISENKGSGQKNLFKHLNGKSFSNYTFTQHTCMYNADVIGLPKQTAFSLVQECVEICDLLCATKADKTYLEQLAFSMVLGRYKEVLFTEKEIMHYWGSKPIWDDLIGNFICDSFYEQRNEQQMMQAFRKIKLSELPIQYRRQNLNRKMKLAADKLFPKLRVRHLN